MLSSLGFCVTLGFPLFQQQSLSLLCELLPWKQGFPDSSVSKESACNAGDPVSILRSGRSPGEGKGYPLQYSWASLVAQLVKYPPAMREIWVWSLSWEDPLEKGKATHSSILAWKISWTVWPMGWKSWTCLISTLSICAKNVGALLCRGIYVGVFISSLSILSLKKDNLTVSYGFILLIYFFTFIYWGTQGLSCSIWDLIPQPGMESCPPALGVRILTHRTTREVPSMVLNNICMLLTAKFLSPALISLVRLDLFIKHSISH